MKVLVTGSAGFIGSALSIRLLDRGDDLVEEFGYKPSMSVKQGVNFATS